MPKSVTITPEVRAVLERAECSGNMVVLRSPDLPRATYQAVDKVLRALGGKWERGPRAHVFNGAADRLLADALADGVAVDRKRTAEQFFTPPDLARRLSDLVVRRGDHVLEPSAGDGALVRAALARGAGFITAVERDEVLAKALVSVVPVHGGGLWLGDFMEWTPVARAPIDSVLMNPPFSGNQDIAHVTRAFSFLRPGGRLAAITSPHWTFATDRASRAFRAFIGYPEHRGGGREGFVCPASHESVANAMVEMLPAGTFREAGSSVASVLLTLTKGA